MNFVALDFETATNERNSACAIAIVTYEDSKEVDHYYSLIRPPNNYYWNKFSEIHGITANDTVDSPDFKEIFPEIIKRISGQTIVAHNETFDRSVLNEAMNYYTINSELINLNKNWQCTMKLYREKGYSSCNLHYLSDKFNIDLDHHNALSDARACGELYACCYEYKSGVC